MNATTEALMVAAGVRKVFRGDANARPVLDDVQFTLHSGEIVACLGKSGSGKSTFLRILAGLIPATGGGVTYKGSPITGPVHGVGMVFQSFALFPWLTVLGNVELGLEAQKVPPAERRKRALAAIDLIGLDGFESAYPKELSGGMRQRVGFARALVINPEVLLLDEPFSALDVLTAENLRGDLIDLWSEQRIPTKSILVVSHNIEEAVEMADRIIIFSSNPGRIQVEIPLTLPRPREWGSPDFRRIVDEVYTHLTTSPGKVGKRGQKQEQIGLGYSLPDAPVQQLGGLVETLMEPRFGGRADLPELADYQSLESDELFPADRRVAASRPRPCRGGRYRTDADRPRLRRYGYPGAQDGSCRRADAAHPAGRPYPARARRAPQPQGSRGPVSGRTRRPFERGGSGGRARNRHQLGPPRRAFRL